MKLWLWLLVAALPAAAVACGDETASTTGGDACIASTSVDVNACSGGPCSFKDDVLPIYRKSCALSTACHTGATAQEGLVLGKPLMDGDMTQAEVDDAHAAVVGVDAVRANMKLVTAGDTSQSWLLAKMEYSKFTDCPDIECAAKGCGGPMPTGGAKLPDAEIAVVRAWIQAGAANN